MIDKRSKNHAVSRLLPDPLRIVIPSDFFVKFCFIHETEEHCQPLVVAPASWEALAGGSHECHAHHQYVTQQYGSCRQPGKKLTAYRNSTLRLTGTRLHHRLLAPILLVYLHIHTG